MARPDIDLKNLQTSKKYELFDCKSNPFPITGVSSGYLGFAPTDGKVTEEILAFIKTTYDRKSYGGLVILGDYGFGKTYILRHVERRINEALYYRGTDRACAIYIDNPEPPAIEDFIMKFLDRFGMHKFLTLLWHLVIKRFQENLIKERESFLKKFFPSPVQPSLFEKGNIDIKEDIFTNPFKFVDWLYESRANLNAVTNFAETEIFLPIFKHPDIAKRLSSFHSSSSSESYHKWMETLNYKTSKTLRKEIDPSNFFRSVLTVFRLNGFRHVYFLVDEFEDVCSRTHKKGRLAFCGALRSMIEHNLEYFSLILAITIDAWNMVTTDAPAFADRFVRMIELLGLTKEQLTTMVIDYLNSVRDEKSDHYNTVYPFETDSIDRIRIIAHANHRVALEICYVLFEYAAEKKIKSITTEIAGNLEEIRGSLVKARRGKIEL